VSPEDVVTNFATNVGYTTNSGGTSATLCFSVPERNVLLAETIAADPEEVLKAEEALNMTAQIEAERKGAWGVGACSKP
jgi:hypothetical protein